jgi:hypothetical protein
MPPKSLIKRLKNEKNIDFTVIHKSFGSLWILTYANGRKWDYEVTCEWERFNALDNIADHLNDRPEYNT